jgi:biopolymer transport protein ExbD
LKFLNKSQEATGAELDISPLIDMVFILLIFFMVSTTFVKDMKLELERPDASSASRASTKAIRVHVDRQGAIYLDGNPVKPWMLQSRVRELVSTGGSKAVLVIADRLVPAERLIEVVDQCRLAGAADVGVATDQEAG